MFRLSPTSTARAAALSVRPNDDRLVLRRMPRCPRMAWLAAHKACGLPDDGNPATDSLGRTLADGIGMLAIAVLEREGLDIHATPVAGEQWMEIDHPLLAGHADGIVTHGVAEAPKAPHIICVNTDAETAQAILLLYRQRWPELASIDRILLVEVGEDRFQTARLHYDGQLAQAVVDHLTSFFTYDGPDDVSPTFENDVSARPCASCPYGGFCKTGMTDRMDCHSCAFFTISEDGKWSCALYGQELDHSLTYEVRECHSYHPALVPWRYEPSSSAPGALCYMSPEGRAVHNGINAVKSTELAQMIRLVDTFKGEMRYDA